MDITKPYEFILFGAMDVTKPYELKWFGAMDVTKPTPCIPRGHQFFMFNKSVLKSSVLGGSKRPPPSGKPIEKGGGLRPPPFPIGFPVRGCRLGPQNQRFEFYK